jgi:hypothetical protein
MGERAFNDWAGGRPSRQGGDRRAVGAGTAGLPERAGHPPRFRRLGHNRMRVSSCIAANCVSGRGWWQTQEVIDVAVALLAAQHDPGAFECRVTNEGDDRVDWQMLRCH